MKKILFLCNMLPSNIDAGGILYGDIIKKYGIGKFSYISLMYKIDEKDVNLDITDQILNQYSFRIPPKNLFYKILRKMKLVDAFYLFLNLLLNKKKIINSIKELGFDAIFAPLRGDVLLVLPLLLKKTGLPVYAMVEDTVEAEVDDFPYVYKIKKRNYYALINSVHSLGVAGESMQEYFRNTFNIYSRILRPSFEKFNKEFPKILNKEFNVFFAGNTYAKNELKIFIKALELLSAVSDVEIKFYLAAHKSFSSKSKQLNIINLGWITQKELLKFMDKCHIAYLPYRSESRFEHQMKYAFPGKAGFYISNNLPIFFHGPAYSSFNTFLKTYKVGISCDSLDPIYLSIKLKEFINDATLYNKYQQQCKIAFDQKFSNDVFIENVHSFFNS